MLLHRSLAVAFLGLNFSLAVGTAISAPAFAAPKMNLEVKLRPEATLETPQAPLQAHCTIDLDDSVRELQFSLHRNLEIKTTAPGELVVLGESGLARRYSIRFSEPTRRLTLHYSGKINEPVQQELSPGIINEEGAALMPESFWHPSLNQAFAFEIHLNLPPGWHGMVTGAASTDDSSVYRSFAPGYELPLIAARFRIYEAIMPTGTKVAVWLRDSGDSDAESTLAQTFLKLVPSYIERYSQLIGEFPFPTYTVVENQLETGYAFSGFTLLGPSVIRLPFLLRSSLPHEVLHSWWGNSVEVDYERGNWSEGLTTYMADRAFQIEDGQGATYRRKSLQAFQDFVSSERDFPVRKFVSKNDQGTQAVGYSKTMLIFEMLENHLGSERFYRALSAFYRDYRFRTAGFAELQAEFERVAGASLDAFFIPWLDQTGAPLVTLESATRQGNRLAVTVSQASAAGARPYVLPIRARVRFKDGTSQDLSLTLERPRQEFSWKLESEPARFELDPEFKIFRKLYPEETPLAFSKVFAESREITLSVPAAQSEAFVPWVTAIRSTLAANGNAPTIHMITDEENPPNSGALWIIGSGNRHASALNPLWARHGISLSADLLGFQGKSWSASNGAVFLAERLGAVPTLWIWTQAQQPARVLIPKILHYSGFSFAGFTDSRNTLKTEWPITVSPLTVGL